MNWLVVLHPWPNTVPVVLWRSSLKNVPQWPHVEQRSYCAHYFAVVLYSGKIRQRLISCILFAPSPTSLTWTHPAQSHSSTVWPFCCGPSTLSVCKQALIVSRETRCRAQECPHSDTLLPSNKCSFILLLHPEFPSSGGTQLVLLFLPLASAPSSVRQIAAGLPSVAH